MSELRRQEVAQEDGPKGHLPRAEAKWRQGAVKPAVGRVTQPPGNEESTAESGTESSQPRSPGPGTTGKTSARNSIRTFLFIQVFGED